MTSSDGTQVFFIAVTLDGRRELYASVRNHDIVSRPIPPFNMVLMCSNVRKELCYSPERAERSYARCARTVRRKRCLFVVESLSAHNTRREESRHCSVIHAARYY